MNSDPRQIYKELLEKVKAGKATKHEHLLLEEVQIVLARDNFSIFCHLVMSHFNWQWFHLYVMQRLQAKIIPITDYDKTHTRLLFRMGDQHGKSLLSCVLFAAWCLGKFPNKQILYLTYSDVAAEKPTASIINILISPIYKKIFPDFALADEMTDVERQAEKSVQKLTKLRFTNANSPKTGKQGQFIGVGVQGTYLGQSADIVICDDLLSGEEESQSEKVKQKRWGALSGNVLSRQQKDSVIIVTGTWWARDDPIGRIEDTYITNEHLLEEGTQKWELIEFNSQKDERDYPYDKRKIGEYLWADEKLTAYLDQKQTNPKLWAIKHQNLPMDSDGVLFKATSFRVYDRLPVDYDRMKIIISIDSNYKVTKTSDNAGIVVLGVSGNNAYLLEYFNRKYTLAQLLDQVKNLTYKYPEYWSILVENKAQGQPFIDMAPLYQITKVHSFEPKKYGDKWERAQRALPIYDAGQMFVPSEKLSPSINIYLNQHLSFTGQDGYADDLVDATTQALIHYDYLFRGAPIQQPRSIERSKMMQGTTQRIQRMNPRNRLGFNTR